MQLLVLIVIIYVVAGIAMVLWDFRSNHALHEPPRFIHDRSISTAVVFILLWPYKLLNRL